MRSMLPQSVPEILYKKKQNVFSLKFIYVYSLAQWATTEIRTIDPYQVLLEFAKNVHATIMKKVAFWRQTSEYCVVAGKDLLGDIAKRQVKLKIIFFFNLAHSGSLNLNYF